MEAEPDPDIRSEAEGMLRALESHDTTGDSIEEVIHTGLAFMDDQEVPERLGAYRVMREIGRGGLATVFSAERDGDFSRRVAIKLIRRGLDTDDILERLRRERQILANLDHPYIARMYEGGTSEDGRPYFVMELIEGERIDTWCSQGELSLDQRIDLFHKVCEAVEYAHQNLVLHRDIKPSNLLVTVDGVPKLLDFGIAKVLQSQGDEDTPSSALPTLTGRGERLLTPEFASPEQVRGEPLTTAGDVYSLGVLLYLLLTDQRPYEIERGRLEDVEKIVCEARPSPPSTVIRKRRSRGEPVLPGWPSGSRAEDLDNIVLMALRKEPERRYGSPRQLSDDLRRFQEDLPITARKDTVGYRTSKFVRRHWLAVSITTLIFAVLLSAVVITRQQMKVAQGERVRAERQQLRAESVADFLSGLFESSNPDVALGEVITAREMLDRGARSIRYGMKENPSVRADLMMTMAKNYRHWSEYEEAESLLSESLEIYRQEPDSPTGSVIDALHALAELYNSQESYDEAEAVLQEALAVQNEWPEDDPMRRSKTLGLTARIFTTQGRYLEAEDLFEQALVLHGDSPENTVVGSDLLSDYGSHWRRRQDRERAISLMRQALEGRRRHDNLHSKLSTTMNNLAILLRQDADFEGAIQLYEEIVSQNRKIFGDRTRRVATPLQNMGIALMNAKRLDEAAAAMNEALWINLEIYGENHSSVARVYHGQALLLQVQEQYSKAKELAEKAYEIDRGIHGDDKMIVLSHQLLNARLAVRLGLPEGETLLLAVLNSWRRLLPANDVRIASTLGDLGRLKMAQGEPEAAETLFREAWEIGQTGSANWSVARSQGELGWSLLAQGRLDEAEPLLDASREALSRMLGPDHIRTLTIESHWLELQEARQQAGQEFGSPKSSSRSEQLEIEARPRVD